MSRFAAILLFCIAAGCGQEPEPTSGVWTSGRDGLCLTGGEGAVRGGLVVYGEGRLNCSLAGPVSGADGSLRLTPAGDTSCSVDIRLEGDRAVIGPRTRGCSYYCGPTADYSGKVMQQSAKPASSVTDLAGDPLC